MTSPRSARDAASRKLFISYQRNDTSDVSGRIYDWLTARLPRGCVFKDVYSLDPGDEFTRKIEWTIQQSKAMLVVIGPHWLEGVTTAPMYVRLEIEMGLRYGLKIIPVLVNGASMPAAEQLPESIREVAGRNAQQIRGDPDFPSDMNRLGQALGLTSTRNMGFGGMLQRRWIAVAAVLLLIALGVGILSQVPTGNPVWLAVHPASSRPIPVSSYAAALPGVGCDSNNPQIQWTTAKGTIRCDPAGTILTKPAYSTVANILDNGEIHFNLTGQPLPSRYEVEVTVTNLNDPASSVGSCAGFELHTSADGETFEELAVCGNGTYALVKFEHDLEIYRDQQVIQKSNLYVLTGMVTESTITFMINNGTGGAATLSTSSTLTTTSYICLAVFWHYARATAEFSNFHYRSNI